MAYRSLNLGALVLNALRTAVKDPALQKQADEATSALDELNSRVSNLVDELEDNDALDAQQTETLAGIQSDLADLAGSLTPALVEVEAPTEDTPVEDTPVEDTPVEDTPTDEA